MEITKEFLEYLKKKHDISNSPSAKGDDYIFYRRVEYPYEVIMAIEIAQEWEDYDDEFEPIEDYFINNIVHAETIEAIYYYWGHVVNYR